MTDHDEREDYDDQPWKGRADLAALVHWPALLLCVSGMIQLGFSLVGCVWLPGALLWNWIDPEFFDGDGPQWDEVLVGVVVCAVYVGLNWVVVVGTRRLARFESYRLAVAAVLLSCVPVPFLYCGVVTVPIAIWGLVLLAQSDVRARFAANRRGTMTPTHTEPTDARADRSP